MSKTAEDVSASLSSSEPTLEPVDAIADLLVEGVETEDKDEEGEATPPKSSTESEDDESNDESEAGDEDEDEESEDGETDLELVADGEVTWEGVLGVSEDQLSFDEDGNVSGFRTKVNGEEEIIKAADLIAGYQNNKHVTQKSQALSEATKAFDVQKGQVEQVYASKLETIDTLAKHFEGALIAEYDNVDWDKLRNEDPAEYAAARSDYAVKANQMKSILEAINKDKATHQQETAESANVARQAYLKTQYEKMVENNPAWSDENVLKAAHTEYKSFVQEQYGFGDAEWALVNDSRLIELIKDAKKYHAGAKVAERKRAKPVPKFQKSRGVSKPKTSKLEKLTAAAKNATGAEKRDLQSTAVATLLLGGT